MKKLFLTLLFILGFSAHAVADCAMVEFDNDSNIIRLKITDSTTGNGKTGLTSASSGLIIGTIADNEATSTAYTAAGSTTETITTLGTYAAPTATKARFKEVDATNHKGLYEIQLANARFSVANATNLIVSVSGVSGTLDSDCSISLVHPLTDVSTAVLAKVPAAPSACAVPGTATLGEGIAFFLAAAKNKVTCTSSSCVIYAADDTTPICTYAVSDNGTTFTSGAGS